MTDQASKLRELIHIAEPAAPAAFGELPLVVVAGGRSGVGATTVAANLAAVLADRGERVLLIDAAELRSGVMEAANVRGEVRYSLADVIAGKCSTDEAIMTGAAGVRVLAARGRVSPRREFESRTSTSSAGARNSSTWIDSRRGHRQVFAELQALKDEYDFMVADVGSGITAWTQRFWLQARLVALVTTADDAALCDAYAAIKLCVAGGGQPSIRLVVNQADSDHAADDAQRRVEQSCRRFLSLSVPALPALPHGMYDASAGAGRVPRVWELPNSPFGHAALWLGRTVSDVVADGSEPAAQARVDAAMQFTAS